MMRDRLGISLGVALGMLICLAAGRVQSSAWAASPRTGGLEPQAAGDPAEPAILLARAAQKKKSANAKGAQAPKGDAATAKTESATDAGSGGLRFSRDIAPIFVGNCIECHNPERRRGKFDLTTFQKLMTGSAAGPVIVAGKPAESPLVRHIKGVDEPKMPPNNRDLAPEVIAKIEAWVKAGARLDAGVDPAALLRTIAPTEEDRRRADLAKLSPAERDQKVEAVALERWAKASPKSKPEMTASASFLMFSNLPKERATQTLKVLEAQALGIKRLLTRSPSAPVLDFPEKLSVYVFNDAAAYVEFARAVESREVEPGNQAHANLAVQTPYLVAVDPSAGREEEAVKKRSGRSKRSEGSGGPERSLAGVLVEQLAAAGTAQAGKAPRWLTLGLGAHFGMQVEPRSPYYRRLREEAVQQYKLGWQTKAQEALGDTTDPDKVRAIGFSLVEWLAASDRAQLTMLARLMLDGGDKLDTVIRQIWQVDRNEFLIQWGTWVAMSYGRGR
jgi:mono/diheme cytochrome c family protein